MGNIKVNCVALTEDKLLGGRVRFCQPASGYRVAIDPVLLASAVPAVSGSRVLDLGTGVGAAAICLAVRVADCQIDAVELQPEFADIAADNVKRNSLNGRLSLHVCDVMSLPSAFSHSFDHVMANPPYLPASRAAPPSRHDLSKVECSAGLADWVAAASNALRLKGSLTFIHRADRLDELLALVRDVAGEIIVAPLWSHPGKVARRVLVRARKGVSTPLRLVPGLTLYDNDGGYTAAAESILRGGAPFAFNSECSYPDACGDSVRDVWTAS